MGRELQRRGHRITWFHMVDLADRIRREDLEFFPIGQAENPLGSLTDSLATLGRLQGLPALRFTIQAIRQTTEMLCRRLPDALREAGVDALLVDQTEPAGGSVADYLGLPFLTICNALALNRDPFVPPPFTPWDYHRTWWARLRNSAGYSISNRLMSPVHNVLTRYREQWSLPPLRSPEDSWSRLAQISQLPHAFDFPRQSLPDTFHYVGPLRDPVPRPSEFPWERVDGRPLIYSSLGTLQNGKARIFRYFAEACANLPVQLVITHGGGLDEATVRSFPGNPLVVSYAPQLAVLEKCCLTLTHAGLNTVLDSLSQGVPVVAVPITYEQPSIAARLRWTGTGRSIAPARLNAKRLRQEITAVLDSGDYRKRAKYIAESIRECGGTIAAAGLVEELL